MEQIEPQFKGTLQIKNAEGKFVTVGAVKLYSQAPTSEGKQNPTLKGYIGINGKEFYEISLWKQA